MKLAMVLCLALLGACSKKEAAPSGGGGGGGGGGDTSKVASCLMESVQSCREYNADNLALGVESIQKLCTAVVSTAKFSETACPTAKLIGTCTKPEGKDFFYEGYYEDAKKIEDTCKQGGGTFATK